MASLLSLSRTVWRVPFQKRYLFHLLFWIMYAVFMILELQVYTTRKGFLFTLAPLAIYFLLMALLVYGNTRVLIPLFLLKRKIPVYTVGVILVIVLYTYFRSLNQQYWDAVVWPDDIMAIRSYYFGALLYGIWFIIISSMLFFTQQWWEQQQRVKNIEINQLKTELKYLRSQLNPHFLFNGLNTIYGNIDIRDQKARDTLLQFSDLLRYSLYEADTDFIELEKEARHLENYVALQRARSDANIDIELTIRLGDTAVKIASLIFMPFVENAFKFCSRFENRQNNIYIGLEQQGATIIFRCRNTYEEEEPAAGGIGQVNVRRRLELLYPDNYKLSIRKGKEFYEVELVLN